MVNPSLLQQVSELDRSAQVELIDFLYGEIDDGSLDRATAALLDERLADMEANPADQRPVTSAIADLKAKWL